MCTGQQQTNGGPTSGAIEGFGDRCLGSVTERFELVPPGVMAKMTPRNQLVLFELRHGVGHFVGRPELHRHAKARAG